jgi:hypothetical protein
MRDLTWLQRSETAQPYLDSQPAPPLPARTDRSQGAYVPTTAESEVKMAAREQAARRAALEPDVYQEGRELLALADIVRAAGDKIASMNDNDPEGQALVQRARQHWVASRINRLWGRP